ncbi:MAG TPA: PIN domain-containing protein, partial [Polyangiaceae bacterium]|nr:PIN domain-containing protein [Polyangiaceae bacterium]
SARAQFHVPAGVVGQVWRNGSQQAILARFLKSPEVSVEPLDEHVARACGEVLAAAKAIDVIDASVVILARERGSTILTSDVEDIRRLDPTIRIERV